MVLQRLLAAIYPIPLQRRVRQRQPLSRQLLVVNGYACVRVGMLIAKLCLEAFFIQKLKELSDA